LGGLAGGRDRVGGSGWLAAVSAAIEVGELAPHDPEMTAIIVLGAMIEAATLIAVAPDRRAARERSEAVVVDLLEGLRR
jgi:hypothetical protein